MAKFVHTDIYDNGLSVLSGAGSLTMSLCQGAPTSLSDANTLASGGGNRVSDEITVAGSDVTLGDGSPTDSRQVTIAAQQGTVQEDVQSSPDLWVAVYDGSRLLLVTDETTDQPLTSGNTLQFGEMTLTWEQPS